MNPLTDIVVSKANAFDEILADVGNAMPLDVTHNGSVTIDDIVCIVSIHRNAMDDRSAWWKIRREAYARYASHGIVTTRTLAAIPDLIRNELALLNVGDIELIARRWIETNDSTPSDHESAIHALRQLVEICARAKDAQFSVLLRTNQPPNAFEIAFNKTDGKRMRNFQKAFDSWDESKRHEAHERYNYYLKQGIGDCLDRVLRDFTRPKTSRLNLKTDQRKIQKYISKRVKDYSKSALPDLGDSNDPLTMISLVFDVEYEGRVDLIFDTRPNSAEAIELVEGTEHCLELNHWHEAVERFACENLSLKVTLLDGAKVVVEPDSDGDEFDNYIGNMLRDILIAERQEGAFSKLQIADACVFCVGGTHTNYFWLSGAVMPQDESFG